MKKGGPHEWNRPSLIHDVPVTTVVVGFGKEPVPLQATPLPGPFEWNMSNVFQVISVMPVGEKVPWR